MAEAIDVRCGNVDQGTGDIRAKIDAVHIHCTDVPSNKADGTQHRYRYRLTPPAGLESATWSGYSELFTTNADGEHTWEGYVFPGPGDWTITLWDEELDAAVQDATPADVAVTVTVV